MIFQLALVVGIFFAVTGGLEYIQHLIATKAKQEVAIQQCAANTVSLEGVVGEQNAGAKKVKEAADARVAAAKREADKAKAEAAVHAARAEELANAKPSVPADSCKSWNALATDYIEKRQGKR